MRRHFTSLALSALGMLSPLPALSDAAGLPLPLTARGTEPGWALTVSAEGSRYTDMAGTTLQAPFVPPRPEGSVWLVDTAAGPLRLTPAICRDAMTGLPHPFTATLAREGATLSGCAGDPAALLAGDWVVTDLDGAALPDGSDVTLSFAEGRIAGRAACNRFSGGVALTGEGLSFGPLAATRMACPDARMAREAAVFAALGAVAGFDIDDTGHLVLRGADGAARLRARR